MSRCAVMTGFAMLLLLTAVWASAGTEADPFVTDLMAGKDLDVGDVLVWNDAGYLYVKYVTVQDWCLTSTKLHVATSPGGIPQTGSGNPKPGHFDYKASHDCITDTTYQIPLTWVVDTELYIAAKAEAQGTIGEAIEASAILFEGAWGAGMDFPGRNWATYFAYTVAEHLVIGWANLQWPDSMTVALTNLSDPAYGQVWIDGVTSLPGLTPGLRAQLGFGPDGTDPDGHPEWTWVEAAFNVDAGNNDEFVAAMDPTEKGEFDYLYRYSLDDGLTWVYADLDGIVPGGLPPHPGAMAVIDSVIEVLTTIYVAAPGYTPVDSLVYIAGNLSQLPGGYPDWDPRGVVLTKIDDYLWTIALGAVPGTTIDYKFTLGSWDNVEIDEFCQDMSNRSLVLQGQTVNDTVDHWRDLGPCSESYPMDLTFNVTVPTATPIDDTVYVAGSFSGYEGTLPDWDPHGIALTKVADYEWTVTLHGMSGVSLEYKYTLGSWEHVEKGASCEEVSNRGFTTWWGTDGTQTKDDIVPNWRNIAPCGD